MGRDVKAMIRITTTDKEFANDLNATGIEGVSVYREFFVCDSIDWSQVSDISTYTFVIDGIKEVALSVIGSWVYERITKKDSCKYRINNADVTNDPVKAVAVIKLFSDQQKK